MNKFYHTIGHKGKNGEIIFSKGYLFEKFLYNLRQMIAFIICPELRVKIDRERYNMDYIIRVRQEHRSDTRARDKAINRLQKQLKNLRQKIREQNH